MHFAFTESQEAHRRSIQAFAAEALTTDSSALEQQGQFDRAGWDACARFGIHGGPLPTAYGGGGLDLVTFVAGLEALGESCADQGLMFSIGAHVLACALPIAHYGTDRQKDKWLPPLVSGEKIAAVAIAEEHGASDAFDLRTTVTPHNGGYVLSGTKSYITNAPFFDVALVFARDPTDGDQTVCLLVDRATPGVEVRPATEKLGLKTSPFGDIVFDDCQVGADGILGASGKMVFMSAMEWERGCLLAPMVGAMRRQLEDTVARINARKKEAGTTTVPQVVAHRVVDMKLRHELARLMLYQFAWRKQTRRRANMEASMTKLFASEAILQNALDAMQIQGAFGYTTESDTEREVRDALGLRIASGTSDIQRNIIAKWLRL